MNSRCLLVLFVLLAGCNASPHASSVGGATRLTVLTYNIKHARGEDNTFDYQRLADVITRVSPDLVALQEVDVKTGRSSGVDQAAKLGELTRMHHTFAEAMPYNGGSYGLATLTNDSHLPEILPSFVPLKLVSGPGQEPRVVVITELNPAGPDGPSITFAGTHLCHLSAATRLDQVQQINNSPLWSDKRPAILAGDFNFTPDSDAYRAMRSAGWIDAAAAAGDPQPTYPSKNPSKRIDYVFVRPAERWRIIGVKVLNEPVVSDHAPVVVELEYVQP